MQELLHEFMIFLHNYLTLIHYSLMPATLLVTPTSSDQNTKEAGVLSVRMLFLSSVRIRLIKLKFKVFVSCLQAPGASYQQYYSDIKHSLCTVQYSTVQYVQYRKLSISNTTLVTFSLPSRNLKKDQSLFAVQIVSDSTVSPSWL